MIDDVWCCALVVEERFFYSSLQKSPSNFSGVLLPLFQTRARPFFFFPLSKSPSR